MPVSKTFEATIGHGIEQSLAFCALLEAVDSRHVVEQKGKVEQLDFFSVAIELGQGRRYELHIAKQDGFEFLGVAK